MSVLTRPGRRAARAPETESDPQPRARFRLPHGLASWRFALIVGGILTAGMVALLTVNTSLAAGSITLSGLDSELARQTERQQALETSVEALSSPVSLQQAAIELGMVQSASPAFLNPETGRLSGSLEPAGKQPRRINAPQVTQPEPDPAEATPTPTPPPNPGSLPRPTPAPAPEPSGDGASLPSAETPTPTPIPTPSGDGAAIIPRGDG